MTYGRTDGRNDPNYVKAWPFKIYNQIIMMRKQRGCQRGKMREIQYEGERWRKCEGGREKERERNSPIKVFLFIVNLTCCMYVKFTYTGTIHGAIN